MSHINYEFSEYGINVNAEISVQNDFIDCLNFIQTPFSKSRTLLSKDLKFESFETIVIRCVLQPAEGLKIIQGSHSPQSFCNKIIEKFMEENWPTPQKILFETLTCNPNESQFKYLISK